MKTEDYKWKWKFGNITYRYVCWKGINKIFVDFCLKNTRMLALNEIVIK